MGAHRGTLIVLCIVALLPAAARAASRCVGCHRAHYAERGTCTGCHRGDERSDRMNIVHRDVIPGAYAWFNLPGSPVVRRGGERIEASACRRCHTWRGEGNGLAANLDDLFAVSSPRKIRDAIRAPVAYMPDFRFEEAQIREIVNAVLAAGARRTAPAGPEIPVVIHFEDADAGTGLLFPRACGPCHRILSDASGGLGSGAVGPNLSGLMTRHYPATFGRGERWTPEKLKRWLGNPRDVKPAATMPPVPLSPGQVDELAGLMAGPRDRLR